MRATILAARTETAMERIAAETARLGGTFVRPAVRGDAEHRQVILLEAIVEGLGTSPSPATDAPEQPAGPVEVEPVEAVISVVKESEQPAGPVGKAAKGKGK